MVISSFLTGHRMSVSAEVEPRASRPTTPPSPAAGADFPPPPPLIMSPAEEGITSFSVNKPQDTELEG